MSLERTNEPTVTIKLNRRSAKNKRDRDFIEV